MKPFSIFSTILFLFLCSCSETSSNKNENVVVNAQGDTLVPAIVPEASGEIHSNEVVTQESQNTEENNEVNEEIAKEAIGAAVDITKFLITNLKKNDSIRVANREKMFGYQIGFKIKHANDVLAMYEKIPDKTGVFIIKASRKHYYLVKYEGKSREELVDKLDDYNNTIPLELGRAGVINLNTLCSRREKLTRDEDLDSRQEGVSIPCLICDN